jgi:hypothetical protein
MAKLAKALLKMTVRGFAATLSRFGVIASRLLYALAKSGRESSMISIRMLPVATGGLVCGAGDGGAGRPVVVACDGAIVVVACDGVIVVVACDGVIVVVACDGAIVVVACDGAIVVVTCDGAIVVVTCDGAIVVVACDGAPVTAEGAAEGNTTEYVKQHA